MYACNYEYVATFTNLSTTASTFLCENREPPAAVVSNQFGSCGLHFGLNCGVSSCGVCGEFTQCTDLLADNS